ncbi:fructose-bisphosphatase [Brevundimonas sp. LM2]|uniref:class 1 fructose-bisphosphatase n=1 Tax=Brevundimonas sp. LM2 TaxID=1938605 RepID=UPI000983E0F5|nr:class 1 fructose-bisphosphatase [Brevundimonas sp. LM2]AQR63042.1 fructose-bisphosphatase [Brevundimonas sp. LM2]
MTQPTTLADFLQDAGIPAALREGLLSVADACRDIADRVERAPLTGHLGALQQSNVQGETQKALDVIANDIFLDVCGASSAFAALASEEMEQLWAREGRSDGPYLLVFDPLDGSSNIEISAPVGTIFSILPRLDDRIGGTVLEAEFLQPGSRQAAAGYALYGAQTLFVFSVGSGVAGFTLDRADGSWRLTHPDMRVPPLSAEYAINAAHRRHWDPGILSYVEACEAGASGPLGRDRNMRWSGAMVADVHRILVRGGVFLYPADRRPGQAAGKLRLLYECAPAGWLIEQAGGRASDSRTAITAIRPGTLHQRVPIALGSADEIATFETYAGAED